MTPLLPLLCLIASTPGPTGRPPADASARTVHVTLIDGSLRAQTVELLRLEAPGSAGEPARCIFMDAAGAPVSVSSTDTPARFPLAIAPDGWTFTAPTELIAPGPTSATSTPTPPLASSPPSQVGHPVSVIELVDGQRLTGSLASPEEKEEAGAPGSDQSLRWNHPRLGVQEIPLERVRSLRLPAAATPGVRPAVADLESLSGVPDSDIVLLANGDRLTGFVDQIGGPSGEITVTPPPAPSVKPQPVRVPLKQTAYVVLANAAIRPTGIMLWLGDGSVVATDRLAFDAAAGRVTLAARAPSPAPTPPPGPPSPGASLDLNDLRAIALDSSRLTALSSLGIAGFAPTGDRRIAEPPLVLPVAAGEPSPLGADDIVLPGPMSVEWKLPARASRLAGWITLEPSAWAWGDCTVTIALIEPGRDEPSEPLARRSVSAAQPIMPVNVELPGLREAARLRVTVDAGDSGPIQDRVRLRRMLIVSEPAAH